MTRQEIELFFNPLENIDQSDNTTMEVTYSDIPQKNFEGDWQDFEASWSKKPKAAQMQLFPSAALPHG